MAKLSEALFARLSNDSAVSAIASSRIYPRTAPQNVTRPFVVFYRIDSSRDYHLTAPSGLVNPRIQFDCWAETYTEAEDLREAIRKSLSGGQFTAAGLYVPVAHAETEQDIYSEDLSLTGVSIDFTFWHHEDP